jgi:hypothetical protein
MNELLTKIKALRVPSPQVVGLDHLGRHQLKEIERQRQQQDRAGILYTNVIN